MCLFWSYATYSHVKLKYVRTPPPPNAHTHTHTHAHTHTRTHISMNISSADIVHSSRQCGVSFLLVLAVIGCQTTVTVLSVILSLVLTLSLSTCAVSAVVHAVMYKRLQRCRAELRGGELCSAPQLSQSLL